MKKYSLLGIVLTAASAVIAVALPAKEKVNTDAIGTLKYTTDFLVKFTCVRTYIPNYGCFVSATTDTSANMFGGTSSTDDINFFEWSTSYNDANTTA